MDEQRDFQPEMGRVFHQPVSVRSHTNKRFTVNYRAPVEQLQKLVPEPILVEELRDTGLGMISYCVCDFRVDRLGPIPIPKTQNNEMLLRLSVLIPKDGAMKRAYYTIRSDASSKFLGFLGGKFSHFRKAISKVELYEDEDKYEIRTTANDERCDSYFKAKLSSITKEKPDTTIFSDINEATEFIFELDGSCGYSFKKNKLSFGELDYPDWDIYFSHQNDFAFNLLDFVLDKFGIEAELDSTLYMENVKATWKRSKLYRE